MKHYEELKIISDYKSVCIIGHTSPDADALASMVVFKNFLYKNFSLDVIDIFAECFKPSFQCNSLLENETINPTPRNYDVAIMMDCPNTDRLGEFKPLFDNSKLKIVIDHHQTNLFQGDINIVEQQGSTCEIVYEIVKEFQHSLSVSDMEKIYAGIITDTNNFTVGKFNQKTFQIVSEIIDIIDHEAIYNMFFCNNAFKNMQLLATAINNISRFCDNQIIISHISNQQAKDLNAKFEDFIGIINRLATINGSKLICFIYPKHNSFYVSMRARGGFKVSHIAKENGGGGHDGAAAFLSESSIEEIEKMILLEFSKLISN